MTVNTIITSITLNPKPIIIIIIILHELPAINARSNVRVVAMQLTLPVRDALPTRKTQDHIYEYVGLYRVM